MYSYGHRADTDEDEARPILLPAVAEHEETRNVSPLERVHVPDQLIPDTQILLDVQYVW